MGELNYTTNEQTFKVQTHDGHVQSGIETKRR